MVNLFDKILRAGEGREVRRLEAIAQRVGEAEDVFTALSDDELRAETEHFRERHEDGENLDDDVFARLIGRLTSVQGDFADIGTYQRVSAAIRRHVFKA